MCGNLNIEYKPQFVNEKVEYNQNFQKVLYKDFLNKINERRIYELRQCKIFSKTKKGAQMPRVACLDSQTKKERAVYALIVKRMIECNKEDEDLAKYLNIHINTFRRKKRHPDQFTLPEMRNVARYLKFEERDKILCL